MGLRFEQDSHSDDGICALGQWDLVKIWAGKWEYDPPFRTLYEKYHSYAGKRWQTLWVRLGIGQLYTFQARSRTTIRSRSSDTLIYGRVPVIRWNTARQKFFKFKHA